MKKPLILDSTVSNTLLSKRNRTDTFDSAPGQDFSSLVSKANTSEQGQPKSELEIILSQLHALNKKPLQ